MSDFKYYRPSFIQRAFIEVSGLCFTVMIFLGIWLEQFRWRLIFSAIFLLLIVVIEFMSMEYKDKELIKIKEKEELSKSTKGGKHGKRFNDI